MTVIITIALVAFGLCYGAYAIGKKSANTPVLIATLLLPTAWYLLVSWKFTTGEGASVGVAVIAVGAWFFGGLCLAVTATMLYASYKFQDSIVALGVLVFAVTPLVLYLGYNLAFPDVPHSQPASIPSPAASPKDGYVEGYAWAVDNGIASEQGCPLGNIDFMAGCKSAVTHNQYKRP